VRFKYIDFAPIFPVYASFKFIAEQLLTEKRLSFGKTTGFLEILRR